MNSSCELPCGRVPTSDNTKGYPCSILQALYEACPDGILVVRGEGQVASYNRQFLKVWELPLDGEATGGIGTGMVPDAPLLSAVLDRVKNPEGFLTRVRELYGDPQASDHCEVELRDGRTLERDSTVVWSAAGANLGRVWFFRDITVRKRMEASLRNSEQRFRAVAEAAQDAMILVNSKGIIQYWNPAAERTLGYSAEEAVGKSLHQWIAPARYQEAASTKLNAFLDRPQSLTSGKTREFAAIRKGGIEIPVELSVASLQIDGEWCAIGILRDISSRREAERRLITLARSDGLTGLPNRVVFVEDLQHAILRSRRSQSCLAVFYLDLDHFKDVNDTLGHPAGDLLLQFVGERLRKTVRETDTVARFGGDEFAILATELMHPTDAGILAEKLLDEMARPFFIEGHQVHSGASLGIALQNSESSDAETILAHADMALYRAKAEGRGRFNIFTAAMDREVRARVQLLAELRGAIDEHQLSLVYQPQVDMQTRAIVGLEALVRWNHPVRGMIPPSQFIPAAENSGLIITLGQAVLSEACQSARRWLDLGIELPVLAVNVSPTQFKASSELARSIVDLLQAHHLNPGNLEIEVTETALMHASQHNEDVLQSLREQGVRIAIDDFGTGYSCLDYLRRYSVSRIKIAQVFVADIAQNQNSAAITRATIGLGRELGLSVIAEGVETMEQAELLQRWGCREAQGYYFARPMSFEDATTLLQNQKPRTIEVTLPQPWGKAQGA